MANWPEIKFGFREVKERRNGLELVAKDVSDAGSVDVDFDDDAFYSYSSITPNATVGFSGDLKV